MSIRLDFDQNLITNFRITLGLTTSKMAKNILGIYYCKVLLIQRRATEDSNVVLPGHFSQGSDKPKFAHHLFFSSVKDFNPLKQVMLQTSFDQLKALSGGHLF